MARGDVVEAALQQARRLTRAETLALDPARLLAAAGRDDEARATVPVALMLQLQAEGTPVAGLETWIALLHRGAEERLVDPAGLEFLRSELRFLAGDRPRFLAWAGAVGWAIQDAASLENALALVVEARQAWLLTSALREADARGVRGTA